MDARVEQAAWHNRAAMTYDLAAATAHLRAAEPRFAPLIERHGVPTLTPTRDPFASLGSAIIYQQLAGAAAKTIHGRVCALFPRKRFPRPAALAATPLPRLRSAGLSEAKARALLDLAAHFGDRRLTTRGLLTADDEAVARLLLPVRGIGPWSVDMFLRFGLGRADVWPVGDFGRSFIFYDAEGNMIQLWEHTARATHRA